MKANEILTVMNDLKDSSYQKILINGKWGIGKTKYVLDFKNDYKDVCYISLFGKKNINDIIQEIYFRIIETAPTGYLKKQLKTIPKILSKVNFSYYGVSVSVPFIENLYKSLQKELDRKETYIIIFDDLERKHDDLSSKEILGLLDSLSKIDNIKTVLIAAEEQLQGDDKSVFESYQEKAVDRKYTVESFAVEAPVNILGKEVWEVVSIIAKDFQFTNLRTFEKTHLFIEEVMNVLGEDVFSEKFTKSDLFKMCFATVIFITEHNGDLVLLKDKDDFSSAFYRSDTTGNIEYMYTFILKNSLENIMSKSVFHHIKKWYEIGSYSKENIFSLINSINNHERNPSNFFSSEQEIIEVIDHTREYISKLNDNVLIDDIVSVLSESFTWCEIFCIDFGISNEEILFYIKKNIANHINLEEDINNNRLTLWNYHIESQKGKELVQLLNDTITVEYYDQLLDKINDSFHNQTYESFPLLRQLSDSIILTSDNRTIDTLKDKLLNKIEENQYFFPIPSGKITEENWRWCRQIIEIIKNIDRRWSAENFFTQFRTYIIGLEVIKTDKMLQYRLKQFFGEI